jgi:flagellar FliG-like protein
VHSQPPPVRAVSEFSRPDPSLVSSTGFGLESFAMQSSTSLSDLATRSAQASRACAQAIAALLAHLEPQQSAHALLQVREALRAEVLERIAKSVGDKAAADLLTHLTSAQQQILLDRLRDRDAARAAAVEKLIFSFEDLREVADHGFRKLMRLALAGFNRTRNRS